MHRSVWVEAGPSDLHGEPRSWLVAGLAGQWMGAEIFYHYDPDMNQCLCVAYRYPSQSHIGHCEKCGEVRPVRSAAAVDRPAREQWASGHGRQEPSLFIVLVPLLGARRLTTYR